MFADSYFVLYDSNNIQTAHQVLPLLEGSTMDGKQKVNKRHV